MDVVALCGPRDAEAFEALGSRRRIKDTPAVGL